MDTFRAFVLRQTDGQSSGSFEEVARDGLTFGDVLIRVAYSSLNYKDGLAVTGKPGVVRTYPMIPGVDLAGTVIESLSPEFSPGQNVVVTGCGTSETIWGGYSQMARMKAEHVVPLPDGITFEQAMAVGTAGFTAMQSVMALEAHGLKPGAKPVLVTGAAGGVGSVSVAILSHLGFHIAASTGRPELTDYLRSLGATEIVDRATVSAPSPRPMDSERWNGAIDSVGGDTLSGVIRSLVYGTSVASCGLAGGFKLTTSVFPFILRGVSLLGIDSVRTSKATRRAVWKRISTDLPLEKLNAMFDVEPLSRIQELGEQILLGKTRGRVVIDVNR